MNENGGKGLFYGVIGVATLIVAIIGATFAWFTATAGGDTTTNVTSGTLTISYDDSESVFATNLKPATAAQVAAAYANDTCAHAGDTTEVQANETICSIWKFTVTNTGSLYANLSASVSDFAIAAVDGRSVTETAVTTSQEITNGYFKYAVVNTAPGAAASFTSGSPLASASNITLASSTLAPSGTTTQYVVVWLDSAAGNAYQAITASAKITVTANQTNKTTD